MPDQLQERIRAFQESRVILTAVELDVFTAVGEGSGAAAVAERIGADPRATETLLNALTAMELLNKDGEVFRNTAVASRFLTAGSSDSARAALLHIAGLWDHWSRMTDSVRAGTAAGYKEFGDRPAEWTEAFIAAMHRNAVERSAAVLRAVGVEGVKRLLDVGGGSGAYSIAFAQANPQLEAEILDLETVRPIAEGHIRRAGLEGRVWLRTGDLRVDDLGHGYDVVLLFAICHMLSPEENRDLLGRVWKALNPGGRVVIQDFLLERDKTAPKAAALFSLNMLVGTKAGASYSEAEYESWLQEAGFDEIYQVRLTGPAGLMIGMRM